MPREWTENYNAGGPHVGDDEARAMIDASLAMLPGTPLPPGHVRVARLLVYEGEQEWVARTLGRSLPEGVYELSGDCRIHSAILRREASDGAEE